MNEPAFNSSLDQLLSHSISIICEIRRPDKNYSDDPDQIFIASGFVLGIEQRYFVLTAGHFIRSMEHSLDDGMQVRLQYADGASSRTKNKNLLPVSVNRESWGFIDKDGFDFGLIGADYNTAANMLINNVEPFHFNPAEDFLSEGNEYGLLGTIGEESARNESGGYYLGIRHLPVKRILKAESHFRDFPGVSFFGRLVPPIDVESIVGMSGGPIIAFRDTGPETAEYNVIAIQSMWNKSTLDIAGCLFKDIANGIYSGIQSILAEEASEV